MKSDVFNTEINYIKDKRLRDNLVIILNMLPDYFYEVPASSTGKYHPSFSLGEGGLVRHSKVATRIGYTLLNNDSVQNFNSHEKDLLLISILIHDGLKCGNPKEEYTRFDHPILISNFIKDICENQIESLKIAKDDKSEVQKGYECGMQIEDYNDLKEGDIIEVYVMEEVKRK